MLELAPIEVGPDPGVAATQRVHGCYSPLTIGFWGVVFVPGYPRLRFQCIFDVA